MRQMERRTASRSALPGLFRITVTDSPEGQDPWSPSTTLRSCDLVRLLVGAALLTTTAKSSLSAVRTSGIAIAIKGRTRKIVFMLVSRGILIGDAEWVVRDRR